MGGTYRGREGRVISLTYFKVYIHIESLRRTVCIYQTSVQLKETDPMQHQDQRQANIVHEIEEITREISTINERLRAIRIAITVTIIGVSVGVGLFRRRRHQRQR